MSNGLMMLAILPGILIIVFVYRIDKVEKEPWRLILKLMLFGAISCVPASFMESAIDGAMPYYPEGSLPYALMMAFCSAALCEELCKFAFLRFGTWRNPEFGYRFDGIVYAVAVAVGFAVLENVMYVSQFGFYTGLVRAVMAVPLHAFCGVFMGIFYGAAKQAQVMSRPSAGYILLALLVPMMIHGIYDTLAFLDTTGASIVLLAFVVLMYIVSVRFIRKFSKEDWKSGFYPDTQPLSVNHQNRGHDPNAQPMDGSRSQRQTAASGYRAYPGQVQDGKLVLLCPCCGRGLRVPVGMGPIRIRCPHCDEEFLETT